MPKVSFIMPVYGVEEYLNQAVDSILAQTFTDFELILVDDGSPDQCPAICDNYAEIDSRVKVLHIPNSGVSEARNNGIRIAIGEWAYIIDADDWLEINALENVYNAAIRDNSDCVMSDVIVHYSQTEKRGRLFSQPFVTSDREIIEKIQKFILCHKYSPYYTNQTLVGFAAPWSKFVRMSVLKDNNVYFDPYVKGRFDDGLWSLHMLDYVNTVSYIDVVTYNYRMIDSSITHSFKANSLEIINLGFEKTEQFITETGKDESFLKAHYGRVVSFLALQLSQYFFNSANPKSQKEIKKELKNVIQSEPYAAAIRKVDAHYLSWNHRAVLLFAKIRWIYGMKLYAKLKNYKKS